MTDYPVRYLFTTRGTIYYTPYKSLEERSRLPTLPIPPCRPRERRPHSIHITRLPPGFVPFDIRPPPPAPAPRKPFRLTVHFKKLASRENAKRVLGSVWAPFSTSSVAPSSAADTRTPITETNQDLDFPLTMAAADSTTIYSRRSALGLGLDGFAMSRSGSSEAPGFKNSAISLAQEPKMAPLLVDPQKPVFAGNGVSCSIILAEPVLFLKGLDHDGFVRDSLASSGAICRGKLQLSVTKSAKIKAVTLKFTGNARTEWPEGIPPSKTENHEEESLRTQIMPFFNAMYEGAEDGYGTLCNFVLRNQSANSSVTNLTNLSNFSTNALSQPSPSTQGGFFLPGIGNRSNRSSTLSASKEAKRLSLQTVQSRSHQKGETQTNNGPTPQQKGYKVFHPGIYEYHFVIPIDNNSPETTKLHLASVVWMLEVMVERAGTFRSNLQGFKEISVIRSPSEDSLELVEPISISRKWEDQLHYEIIISGKSFPLGSKIPIAFKLTPLAKVQVHKLKVYVSENIEYFTSNKKVTRKEMARKILLLEKNAGRPLSKDYSESEVKVLAGGEPDPDSRGRIRELARRQREREAAQAGTEPAPLPEPVDNMLGDLDLGLEGYWGQTEIEMNVQLPTCEAMEKDKTKRLNHACTWKNVNVHHWIKIVMRISRADADDPTGKKRRHFEISIDSPLTILNCRATQANLALPQYSDLNSNYEDERQVCGCPNAAAANDLSPISSTDTIDESASAGPENDLPGLARPPQAHLHTNNSTVQRPMHMLRNPSFNPPAFDAEDPPPPMPTPPPLYDHVIGTPSVDGLADYFARLSEAYDEDYSTDDENSVTSRGRVNVANPRTPGGRLNRSMEIDRNFMFETHPETLRRLNGDGGARVTAT